MITLHHLEYSQSFRILWLLEELGAPYELKLYERDPATRLAPAHYKAISPLGTAPVITDGDVTLAETNAIVDYILDKHDPQGRLRPAAGDPTRTQYLLWFHASQGSMMPMLLFHVIFKVMQERSPRLIRGLISKVLTKTQAAFVRPRMIALLDLAEQDLGKSGWLAGDALTAADIVMGFCMEGADSAGYFKNSYPNCQAYLARMKATPSFMAAVAKDGKPSRVG